MALLRRLLVPTDFSDSAARAVDYAVELATVHRVPLDLIHVFVPPVMPAPEPVTAPEAALLADLPAELAAKLDELAAELRARGAEVGSAEVVTGAASEEIVRAADRRGCDLIVLGTHGRTGLGRLLIGSVAEKVVRHAHCPVLAVREVKKPG